MWASKPEEHLTIFNVMRCVEFYSCWGNFSELCLHQRPSCSVLPSYVQPDKSISTLILFYCICCSYSVLFPCKLPWAAETQRPSHSRMLPRVEECIVSTNCVTAASLFSIWPWWNGVFLLWSVPLLCVPSNEGKMRQKNKNKTRQLPIHSQHHYSEFTVLMKSWAWKALFTWKQILSPGYSVMWTVVTEDPDSQQRVVWVQPSKILF